jgi:hypothetical protein
MRWRCLGAKVASSKKLTLATNRADSILRVNEPSDQLHLGRKEMSYWTENFSIDTLLAF